MGLSNPLGEVLLISSTSERKKELINSQLFVYFDVGLRWFALIMDLASARPEMCKNYRATVARYLFQQHQCIFFYISSTTASTPAA